ncbi:MAG: YfdX family protein [Candidatus Competibacteraceae bacterium]
MALRKTLLAVAGITGVVLSLSFLAPASAGEHKLIRLSEEGSQAAQAIKLARLALFNGQAQDATKLLEQAKTNLAAAARDVDVVTKSPDTNKGPMIPIDVRLTRAEDFVLSSGKNALFEQVSEHLKQGEIRKAIELLHPDDVHLTLTTVLMPLDASSKAVDEASKLLTEGKYYEANLALKKAEEGWVVDSQNAINYLADVPKYHKHDKEANEDNPNRPKDKPKT